MFLPCTVACLPAREVRYRGVGEGKELSGEVHFSTDSNNEIKIHEEIYVYLCMEQNIHISNHTN